MARSPGRAALAWGLAGFVVSVIVTMALAFAKRQPGEPSDAMTERGRAAAPVVLLATAVAAGLGYLRARKRPG